MRETVTSELSISHSHNRLLGIYKPPHGRDETISEIDIDQIIAGTETFWSDCQQNSIYNVIANIISEANEVTKILALKEVDILHIWTIAKKQSKEVRRAIYDKELHVMGVFPDFVFDFNLARI